MADLSIYTFDEYKEEYNKIFAGVYNDFKMRAMQDYKFELNPLEYDDFVKSTENNLIKCIILFEQDIPTGFLSYTDLISEAVELNIIHVIQGEDTAAKRCALLEKFLSDIREIKGERVISYPILGVQEEILPYIQNFDFKTVNQSVMSFNFNYKDVVSALCSEPLKRLNNGFEIKSWNDDYFYGATKLINEAFKDMNDSKFDTRFLSFEGTKDIIEKIVSGIYGKFLPDETKVLTYRDEIIGICFANLTNPNIANIPLVAVNDIYRGKSFGKYLLKSVVMDINKLVLTGKISLSEINASCDTDNKSAYNMYLDTGFKEIYSYKQAYKD